MAGQAEVDVTPCLLGHKEAASHIGSPGPTERERSHATISHRSLVVLECSRLHFANERAPILSRFPSERCHSGLIACRFHGRSLKLLMVKLSSILSIDAEHFEHSCNYTNLVENWNACNTLIERLRPGRLLHLETVDHITMLSGYLDSRDSGGNKYEICV